MGRERGGGGNMKNHEHRYLGTSHFEIENWAVCPAVIFFGVETFGGAKCSFLSVGEEKRGA